MNRFSPLLMPSIHPPVRRSHPLARLLLAACLTAPAVAVAAPGDEASRTPPERSGEAGDRDNRNERPSRMGPSRGEGRGGDGRDRGRDRERRPPPTSQEWAETRQFLAEHSPTRLEMYEQFEEHARQRLAGEEMEIANFGPIVRLRSRIHGHVSHLRELAEDEPHEEGFALQQFETEDRILATMREAGRLIGQPGHAQAQAEVEAVLQQYVEQSLAERQARLERMSEELEREREQLLRDRERIDEIAQRVADRYRRYLPPHLRGEEGDADRARGRDGPASRPSTRPSRDE